jgi:tetratricopeptide (TPR) repeat protein
VHQRRGDDARAEEDLSRAIDLAPERADAYGNRAAIRAYRGAVDLAISDCEAALDRMPPGAPKRDPIARLLSTLTRAREDMRAPARPPPSGPRTRPAMDLRAKFLRALDGAGLDYTTRRRKTGVSATVRVPTGDKITIVLDEEAPRLTFEATRESGSRLITWETVTPITPRASVSRLEAAILGALEAWRTRRPRSRRAS